MHAKRFRHPADANGLAVEGLADVIAALRDGAVETLTLASDSHGDCDHCRALRQCPHSLAWRHAQRTLANRKARDEASP